jgi:hypothetical protein
MRRLLLVWTFSLSLFHTPISPRSLLFCLLPRRLSSCHLLAIPHHPMFRSVHKDLRRLSSHFTLPVSRKLKNLAGTPAAARFPSWARWRPATRPFKRHCVLVGCSASSCTVPNGLLPSSWLDSLVGAMLAQRSAIARRSHLVRETLRKLLRPCRLREVLGAAPIRVLGGACYERPSRHGGVVSAWPMLLLVNSRKRTLFYSMSFYFYVTLVLASSLSSSYLHLVCACTCGILSPCSCLSSSLSMSIFSSSGIC